MKLSNLVKGITLLALINVTNSFASSGLYSLCPEKFHGKVISIEEELGPETPYSTLDIKLKNLETVRGNVAEEVTVKILKYGTIRVQTNEEYVVIMKKGRICHIDHH